MWSWCTKDTPLPIGNELLKNISNSAEIERNCVSINIDMGNPKSTIIANIFCNTDETTDPTPPNLACELIAKKPNDKMIVNSTCRSTSCGINHQCKKNDAVKKLADKGVDILNIRYGSGIHLSACSRYFLFSYESTTYDDAREKCCALGMKLLSVKSAAKRYCLATLTKSYMEKTGDNDISDVFWTSGTDLDCKGNYRWCSVDRAFVKSEVRWANIKPIVKSERCVTIQMSDMETNTALQTADCSAIKRFVCEVRQSGTTVQSIQDECIDLIGLSKDEVDGLDITKNYTYSMKCFLKCVADNLGMIIFGNMKGGNTLRLMEKYDKENYDFIKNTQTINLCNTKLVPNSDVCQSTYEMFLCGISRQRQFFNKIMSPNNKSNYNDNEPTLMPEIPRACYNRMNVRCGRNVFYQLILILYAFLTHLLNKNRYKDV
ncbi:uncharacterized protein LOC135939885 [Cloeon dipterum]|uniref:uncharacterized protein LOC135939885 n=1 Tax=Cloeon dipterum TaxID=197152 RepID=UPI00321FF71B